MTKAKKIQILNGIAAGTANIYDLIAGDGWFVKVGDFYIGDGYRYTEEQFEKITEALKRQGREPFVLSTGGSCIKWLAHIKPFNPVEYEKKKSK